MYEGEHPGSLQCLGALTVSSPDAARCFKKSCLSAAGVANAPGAFGSTGASPLKLHGLES